MNTNNANKIAQSLIENIENKELSSKLFGQLSEYLNNFHYYNSLPNSFTIAKAFSMYVITHKNKNSQEEDVRLFYSLSLLIKTLYQTSNLNERYEILILISTLLTIKFEIIHTFMYYSLPDSMIDNSGPQNRKLSQTIMDLMLNNYYSIKHYIIMLINEAQINFSINKQIWDLYNRKNKTIVEKIVSGDTSYDNKINGEALLFKCFNNYAQYNTAPLYIKSNDNSWINIKSIGLIKSDIELWTEKYILNEFDESRTEIVYQCFPVYLSFNPGKLSIDIGERNTFKNIIGDYNIYNISVNKLEGKTTISLAVDSFSSPKFIPYEINIYSESNRASQIIITLVNNESNFSTVRFVL